jgi:hypothetical protein
VELPERDAPVKRGFGDGGGFGGGHGGIDKELEEVCALSGLI